MREYLSNNIENCKDKEEAVCKNDLLLHKMKREKCRTVRCFATICVRKVGIKNIFVFAFIA